MDKMEKKRRLCQRRYVHVVMLAASAYCWVCSGKEKMGHLVLCTHG